MRWAIAIILLGFIGCSPVVRLRVTFELPKGALDPSRLHIRGKVACRGDKLPEGRVEPAVEESPDAPLAADGARPLREAAGMRYELVDGELLAVFRGGRCEVRVTVFYDTNNDRVAGAGDFIFEIPTTELRDHGWCVGNMTELGTIALVPWKP